MTSKMIVLLNSPIWVEIADSRGSTYKFFPQFCQTRRISLCESVRAGRAQSRTRDFWQGNCGRDCTFVVQPLCVKCLLCGRTLRACAVVVQHVVSGAKGRGSIPGASMLPALSQHNVTYIEGGWVDTAEVGSGTAKFRLFVGMSCNCAALFDSRSLDEISSKYSDVTWRKDK